jgi:hypothetical protein
MARGRDGGGNGATARRREEEKKKKKKKKGGRRVLWVDSVERPSKSAGKRRMSDFVSAGEFQGCMRGGGSSYPRARKELPDRTPGILEGPPPEHVTVFGKRLYYSKERVWQFPGSSRRIDEELKGQRTLLVPKGSSRSLQKP